MAAENYRVVRAVLVSPSDVLEERDAAEEVLATINDQVAHPLGAHLEVVRFETAAYPGLHQDGPQGLIDQRLRVADSQLVIGVLWSRFGTPTADGMTGTEHELHTAWQAWRAKGSPQVLLYSCARPIHVPSVEAADQLVRLARFKQQIISQGEQFFAEYNDLDDFRERLRRDVTSVLREILEGRRPRATRSARTSNANQAGDGHFLDQSSGLEWSEVVSLELVEHFRESLRATALAAYPAQLDDLDFLRHIGVLLDDGTLSSVGVLLFSEDPSLYFPQAVVQCVRYSGNDRATEREIVTIRGPATQQVEKSLDFVRSRTARLESPSDTSARSEPASGYPMISIREILANAVAHRDYEDQTRVVHVRVFADRVEVASPGYPLGIAHGLEDASLSLLEGQSVKRNLTLSQLLSHARLFEGEGSGIPMSVKNSAEMSAPPPTLALVDGFTIASVFPTSRDPSVATPAGLNPRYTFETFVKGASNQFALAAALRVAETPARSYNPLFIYGSAGLGKTHLLHAIGHYVHANFQHHLVRYVSTETFMNEYVDAIRSNSMAGLRRSYREIDVLLIDDVQFLEGKEGLQEEFFHTFNSLHGANKQIVISSDRMPDAIPTLEERLRGRFKWGLITDIQPPDLETRLAILRNKAERERVQVPAETIEFIASLVTGNVRELEGALIRVTAYASLNDAPITLDLVRSQLADLIADRAPQPRTDEELLAEIAEVLGFDVAELKGKGRSRPLVTARQIAMYVFRELTDLSYPSIARLFGGRDHTTVIHAVEKIQRQMGEQKATYEQVTEVLRQLKAL